MFTGRVVLIPVSQRKLGFERVAPKSNQVARESQFAIPGLFPTEPSAEIPNGVRDSPKERPSRLLSTAFIYAGNDLSLS